MPSNDRVPIPLLAQLIPDGVKPGSLFLVEFDPESQWLAVATTIIAAYLREGGRACYGTSFRSVDAIKENLASLGLDLLRAIDERRFLLYDWYSPTLTAGRIEDGGSAFFEKVGEVSRVRSLKVADLSVEWIRDGKEGLEPGDVIETWPPGSLYVWESLSEFLRFNEEGPFLECMVSRVIPNERRAKRIDLNGIVRDVHTVALYKRLESVHDGVIELRVREVSEEAKSFLRIRSLKGQPHDARWHEIQIKPKGEAVLVS